MKEHLPWRRNFLILTIILFIVLPVLGQETGDDGVVYPREQPGLIYVEAEDAVSTNFTQQPTLDYSSSSQQNIQLSRFSPPGVGQDFYAEFVFLVEEAGRYEFWYAGTPPGPRDQIFPSYVSPFEYQIDDRPSRAVFREDVAVVEQFSATNYWVLVDEVDLDAGVHTIRFLIDQKRRFDSKYYFLLDSFFLLHTEAQIDPQLVPEKFPADMDDRSIDNAYRSINEYEFLIAQDPENIQVYVTIAQVYSLLGDYLNALKYLIRGLAYEPENPRLLSLVAKNRIWKGDVIEGLAAFNRYLELYPEDVDTIAEAAKIAAWTNRFTDSYRLYNLGLALEPDNFNLKVNLGLTYLWNSRVEEGLNTLREALEDAVDDPDQLEELARVYLSNSYPSYAVDVYRQALREYPRHLQFYLGLSEAYQEDGRQRESRETINRIRQVLGENPQLEQYISAYDLRQSLKDQVIQGFRDELAANPDDLILREQLVQTLFWNGQRREAVDEYLNIMGNRLLREIRDLEQRSVELLELLDEHYAYRNILQRGDRMVQDFRRSIAAAQRSYGQQIQLLENLTLEEERLLALESPSDSQRSRIGELPALISEAADVLRQSAQALADEMDSAEEFLRRNSLISQRITGLTAALESVRSETADEQERLESLSSQISWTWNREDSTAELELIRNKGNVLGDYLLLSIARNRPAEELASADAQLLAQRSGQFSDGQRLAAQLQLWLGGRDVPPAEDYFAYGAELVERLEPMVREYRPMGIAEPRLLSSERIAELDQRLVSAVGDSRDLLDVMDGRIDELHDLFDQRLEFAMYLFDTGTYLTRYQIGEYYLSLEEYQEAARQFRAVLRIDPFNANARFRLGSVKQLDGDWSGAMADYLQVYYADPGFENVRQLYNQLARENASVLQIQAQSLADSSRWSNSMSFSLDSPISTVLGFTADYSLRDIRLHKPSGAGEQPVTSSLHSANISLPVNLRFFATEISPKAGITLSNRIFLDEFSDVPAPVLPENLLEPLELSPRFGLSTATQLGAVNIALDYQWYRMEDSFFFGRDAALAHSASATLGTYFGFPNRRDLNSFGTRSFLNGRYVLQEGQNANILYTLVQEIVLSTHLADNPWTNLDFVVSGSFETSSDGARSDYYAPENVLVGKFSMNLASWIGGLSNNRVLGLMPRLSVGYFGERLGSDSPGSSLLLDAAFKFELTQGTGSQYLDLGTTLSIADGGLGYFTFFANIGLYSSFPTLLN